jgi:hypothetical protein
MMQIECLINMYLLYVHLHIGIFTLIRNQYARVHPENGLMYVHVRILRSSWITWSFFFHKVDVTSAHYNVTDIGTATNIFMSL